jgi:hypothetical protein
LLKKIILERETQIQCQKMEDFKQVVLVSKKSILQLIAELEKVFPITRRPIRNSKSEFEWLISGFVLPHSNFEGFDEEQTATALGLVCHLVFILAKYLDIPLRYAVVPKCSRSYIINIQSAHKGQYPLYSRGVDSSRFQYAVFLLNKNVEQLLDSRELGLKQPRELRETLPNLRKLLNILAQERVTILEQEKVTFFDADTKTMKTIRGTIEIDGGDRTRIKRGTTESISGELQIPQTNNKRGTLEGSSSARNKRGTVESDSGERSKSKRSTRDSNSGEIQSAKKGT